MLQSNSFYFSFHSSSNQPQPAPFSNPAPPLTMFANRVISFFFLVATFGLFAYASPIDISTDLQARSMSPNVASSFVSRCDCKCTTQGCNEQAILTILTNLQNTIALSTSAFGEQRIRLR